MKSVTLPFPRLFQFIKELLKQFFLNQGILNASALTYTTLFAIVPLVTVSYSMLAAVPTFQGAGDIIQAWVLENFVPATGEVVHEYLQSFTAQARRLTAVGIIVLFVTSVMMMKNIEAAMNRIWRVSQPRKGVSSFLLYWAVLSLGPLLIGFGLVVTSYITALPAFSSATELVGQARLIALLPLVFSSIAFMLLYAAVPNCSVPLQNAFWGGLCAALIFEITKKSFAFYISQFPSYQLVYGAFSAFPIFLLWIFISWIIILLGAELSRALTIYDANRQKSTVPHLFIILNILDKMWCSQREGKTITEVSLLKQIPQLTQKKWDLYVHILLEQNIIKRTYEGDYVLMRDLNHFSLNALRALLPWPIPEADSRSALSAWENELNQRLSQLTATRNDLFEIELAQLFKSN